MPVDYSEKDNKLMVKETLKYLFDKKSTNVPSKKLLSTYVDNAKPVMKLFEKLMKEDNGSSKDYALPRGFLADKEYW